MNKLLFSVPDKNNTAYPKALKLMKMASLVMCALTILFWIFGITVEKFKGEEAILFSIFPIALILLFGGLYLCAILDNRQYLLIYDDLIKFQKCFSVRESEIRLEPNSYKIKIKKHFRNGFYWITLIFLDLNNHPMLRYSFVCHVQLLQPIEANLDKIGCEIISKKKIT